ncbi:unnamed protein product, partial [Onchocerca ochengi]|uniref:Transposase n=1 Tax=Onchocerca ochengi TaxID=42157 RepID=A0A182ER25_ONCOC
DSSLWIMVGQFGPEHPDLAQGQLAASGL